MFSATWHRYIFLFGIVSLAGGMLFGPALTSIPQTIIAANWFLEKNYCVKWDLIKKNKVLWILISIIILHLLGMIYTGKTVAGWQDLKTKAPLILLPILFLTTKPLTKTELQLLFRVFYLSVVASSLWCFVVYLGYTKRVIVDVRQASVYISHIRFSLFIVLAIIGLGYEGYYIENKLLKAISVLLIIWLLFFMYKLEMATGLTCLFIIVNFLIIRAVFKKFNFYVSLTLSIVGIISVLFLLYRAKTSLKMFDKNPVLAYNQLYAKTRSGNKMYHDTLYHYSENGNLVLANVNEAELEREWKKRSTKDYFGVDARKNSLRFTIFRYMTSKGIIKDSCGLNILSQQDIINIENGVTNYKYSQLGGITARWYELIWEYTKYTRGENPSGHSLTMRLEFWNAAIYIIKQHPIIGVGTGDMQYEFKKAYIKTNSKLNKEWRLRSHNQYLAITVAFGILGLIVFLFYLIAPAVMLRKHFLPLYWVFYAVALLSFFTEDTLETQSGATFFAFFQSLFVWLAYYKQKDEEHVQK